jgi:hypothetical protein
VDVHVARDFVAEFRRRALAPIYYVELPLTQHAFDHTASPRTSSMIRAVVAFAESVAQARRPLTQELIASYQSPPVEVMVHENVAGWEPARDVAGRRGTFYVVSADNAFSSPVDPLNEQRRSELNDLALSRGWVSSPAIGRDPFGAWPEEKGLAIFEQSEAFCRALARAFDQHAIYEVTADDLRVVVVS